MRGRKEDWQTLLLRLDGGAQVLCSRRWCMVFVFFLIMFNFYLFIYFTIYFLFLFFKLLVSPLSVWDLSGQPGIKPVPPALEAQSLNHWTARKVPG